MKLFHAVPPPSVGILLQQSQAQVFCDVCQSCRACHVFGMFISGSPSSQQTGVQGKKAVGLSENGLPLHPMVNHGESFSLLHCYDWRYAPLSDTQNVTKNGDSYDKRIWSTSKVVVEVQAHPQVPRLHLRVWPR